MNVSDVEIRNDCYKLEGALHVSPELPAVKLQLQGTGVGSTTHAF